MCEILKAERRRADAEWQMTKRYVYVCMFNVLASTIVTNWDRVLFMQIHSVRIVLLKQITLTVLLTVSNETTTLSPRAPQLVASDYILP